jgi:UDP-N-acetylmuramate dehydrogenase
MNIKQNYNIKDLNSFGLTAKAKYFATFNSKESLIELLEHKTAKENKIFVLGGGSNILCTQNIEAFVIKNEIEGIEIIDENDEYVILKCGAGVQWHNFVMYCVDNNYYGVENLSLIPGTVGAAPMQNIGAYGVEINSVFEKLDAIEIETMNEKSFNIEECAFGYRESVFKKDLKGKYIITYVYFKLLKNGTLNISYGAIAEILKKNNIETPNLKDVSNAIIEIRNSKLPNPKEIGNAGSFFKNPEIEQKHFLALKEHYKNMPFYNLETGKVKVPAAWLIEQCGWKGFKDKNVGVHVNQALVLVNYGEGLGKDILDLSSRIIKSVNQQFKILLEREVNII